MIADEGDVVQSLHAKLRIKDDNGTWSELTDTTNTVDCNNLYPSLDNIIQNDISYPVSQEAIKDSETIDVDCTVTDFNVIAYSSPNSQLSIPNSTTYLQNKLNVQRIDGDYNIGTTNYRITATRTANDAVSVENAIIYIAHTSASITMVEPATRLRSGGNDGTSIQDHSIELNAGQELISTPTIGNPPVSGGL